MLDKEIRLIQFIQQHRLEELDSFFLFLTSTTTLVSVLLAAIFFIFIRKKNMGINNRIYPLSIALILSLSSLISYLLKVSMSRPRPFIISEEIIQLTTVSTHSFPSGHTVAVTSILFGLCFFYPQKRLLIPIFLWAVFVVYSRLAFGVHFITDVIAGAFLSFVVAFCLHLWMKSQKQIDES